jgi:hypothetical protein
MARGDKKAKIATYFKKNPGAKNGDVAKACGCSLPLVSVVKREMGLTGSRGRKTRSKNGVKRSAKRKPAFSATPAGDVLDHLAAALEYVDSADAMLELLDQVEAAGGIEAVRSALQFHQRISEAIG